MNGTRSPILTGLLAVSALLAGGNRAIALPQFKKQFENLYANPNGNASERALAKAAEAQKCDICHTGGTKELRNVYGTELEKLLDKKLDKNNVAKIQKALRHVESIRSDQKDDKSPTYGELIKAGKLPR